MTRDAAPIQPSLFTRFTVKLASIVSPRVVERRFARAFLTPQRRPIHGPTHSLPPPDEVVRVPTAGSWVRAWRWGEGPAVLVVHGWEDDHHCFDPLIGQLIAAGSAVVAFDLPAHGCSGGRMTNLPKLAAAVGDVAYVLGPVRALVAHSLGGAAAVHALAAGLEVERVALIAAPLSMARYVETVASAFALSAARQAGIKDELHKIVGVRPEALDVEPIAARLAVPALIAHSLDDRTVPFKAAVRLARTWPGAELYATEGLGHRRLLADPALMRRLVKFLHLPRQAERVAA